MIDIDLILIQDTYWGHNKIYQIIWPLYVKGQGHSKKLNVGKYHENCGK